MAHKSFEVEYRSKVKPNGHKDYEYISGKLWDGYDMDDKHYWEIQCISASGSDKFNKLSELNATYKYQLVDKINKEVRRCRAKIRWYHV